ncbi:MAG: CDP-archaeol synthase [Anaerolineae bacterium]
MLRARLLTAVILAPIVAWLIYLGDLPFLSLIVTLTTLAEIEFCLLIARHEFQTVHVFGIALVWLFLLDGKFPRWGLLEPGLAVILLSSLAWQVFHYEQSGMVDWTGTIASGIYIGLCASYLIRLRALPEDGFWWTFIVIPAILFADAAAYLVGSVWGRHRLAPSLSSGKSWEGYIAGVLVGGLMSAFLGWLWTFRVGPGSTVTGLRGLISGTLVAALAPIGDLAISMVKREVGVEDSGKLLPGHGGALDRLDSVLWAAVIGYYCVNWFTK